MITSVQGTLSSSGLDWVDINLGSITVRVYVPESATETLGKLGENIRLFTFLQVREDNLTLYGFVTEEIRSAFQALLAINGVGPRVALNVLSTLTPEALASAVASGDPDVFKGVHGVGSRTANRIVLELKGKLDFDLSTSSISDGENDLLGALTALGYTVQEVKEVISSISRDTSLSLEEKIRLCLQRMNTNK